MARLGKSSGNKKTSFGKMSGAERSFRKRREGEGRSERRESSDDTRRAPRRGQDSFKKSSDRGFGRSSSRSTSRRSDEGGFGRTDRKRSDSSSPRRFDRENKRSDSSYPRKFDRENKRGESSYPKKFDRDENKRGDSSYSRKFDRSENKRGDAYPKKFDRSEVRRRSDSSSPEKFDRKRSSSAYPKKFDRSENSRSASSPRKFERRGADSNFERRKTDSRNSDERPRKRSFKEDSGERSRPSRFGTEKKFSRADARKVNPMEAEAPETKKESDGLIRLNKFMANSGVGSRREADEYIKMGLVTVNGVTVTEMGHKVKATDDVRYEGRRLKAERPVYILLNKPKGFITTTDDPEERKTVMDLVANACPERIYPVGRLDRNTTGLLLLTNDGELADKLTHPSYKAKKVYKVELNRPLTRNDFQKILDGVYFEEGRAQVDDLAIVSDDGKEVGIEIHIGWNRIVRRIFEALGYQVEKLDRVAYAGLDKKELARGQWRFLRPEEVIMLKHFKG